MFYIFNVDLHTMFGSAWYFLRCLHAVWLYVCWKMLGVCFHLHPKTPGTSDLRDCSKIPGINSVCRDCANHECWCCPFLPLAELESGWAGAQPVPCPLPGVTWEGSTVLARGCSSTVTYSNCSSLVMMNQQDFQYRCACARFSDYLALCNQYLE